MSALPRAKHRCWVETRDAVVLEEDNFLKIVLLGADG